MKSDRIFAFAAAILVNLMIARALNHSMVDQLPVKARLAPIAQPDGGVSVP